MDGSHARVPATLEFDGDVVDHRVEAAEEKEREFSAFRGWPSSESIRLRGEIDNRLSMCYVLDNQVVELSRRRTL